MVQWLRIQVPMQGTQVRAQSWKIPHAMKQLSLNATTTVPTHSRACALLDRPPRWAAHAWQQRADPAHRKQRKPVHSNKDQAQPKVNKISKEKKGPLLMLYSVNTLLTLCQFTFMVAGQVPFREHPHLTEGELRLWQVDLSKVTQSQRAE